jgi:B9 domain-containing protein 1
MANAEEQIVWNFPIDVSFNSTNVFGWPRIAISVYGIDFLGRDVIRGYGSALIPLSSGQHQIEIDMFNPLATSYLNDIASWLMGNPPEVGRNYVQRIHTCVIVMRSLLFPQFFDSKFVCQSEGREVSRVKRSGKLLLSLNVATKGTTILPCSPAALCGIN